MLEETGTPAESPLPPAILRGLGDRSYDKRKTAALDVTALIKSLQEGGERDCIANVVNLLAQEFTRSRNVHHRKGGLIGLAACAIGLVPEIERFLYLLIPPVLECFDDPESRVSYYACESLYNISKVARSSVLQYFNPIFDGLCKLFAHVDVDVKNGANLLDRLIKDIVTESDIFHVESFIPLLQKNIKRTKPYIRQLIVGWIVVLNAVPDINMLDYLPEFLDGLFNMLSDNNREIQLSANNALSDFLREIKQAEVTEFGPMVNILVNQCKSLERTHRLAALKWVYEFIILGKTRLVLFYANILTSVMHNISDQEVDINNAANTANQALTSLVKSTEEDFSLAPILLILINELLSDPVTTRVAALQWIQALQEKDPPKMNRLMSSLLPALLRTISDPSDEVVLLTLQILASISLDKKEFLRVLNALLNLFLEDRSLLEIRGALVVRKLCLLLDGTSIYLSLAGILSTSVHLEFVSQMVQSLNLILLTAPELTSLRKSLKNCFDMKSVKIITENDLSNNNNNNDNNTSDNNYDNYINDNEKEKKKEIGFKLDNNDFENSDDIEIFKSLFVCWCHNPVATFSLCLLSQAYDLSSKLVLKFAEVDVTVGFLMQVDKLVQFIESPIFIHLRLQLLQVESRNHGDLLKSLYGLLMLLPQSQAYRTLSDRLVTVSSLQMHIGFSERRNGNSNHGHCSNSNHNLIESDDNIMIVNDNNNTISNSARVQNKKQNSNTPDTDQLSPEPNVTSCHNVLLKRFEDVQEEHLKFRLSNIKQKKLRPTSGNFNEIYSTNKVTLVVDGADSGSNNSTGEDV